MVRQDHRLIIFYLTYKDLSTPSKVSLRWEIRCREKGPLGHFNTMEGLVEIMLRNDFGERFGNDQSPLLSSLKAVTLNNSL